MPIHGEYAPSSAQWVRDQVEMYEKSGGREANTLRDTGLPVIVVTMRGNRSGKVRKIALMRVEHDGEYALVASKGGAPKHPVWYYNLVRNPHVELQDEAVRRDYLAREVSGHEKATWWSRALEAWPDYANYQARTSREIPVFVLEPLAEALDEPDPA